MMQTKILTEESKLKTETEGVYKTAYRSLRLQRRDYNNVATLRPKCRDKTVVWEVISFCPESKFIGLQWLDRLQKYTIVMTRFDSAIQYVLTQC